MNLAQYDSVVAVACVPCEDESTDNLEDYDLELPYSHDSDN